MSRYVLGAKPAFEEILQRAFVPTMNESKAFSPRIFLKYVNNDGGVPYSPGMTSFSEPTLLMALAFISAGEGHLAQPLIKWALESRNAEGSIGLSREFPHEGLWNTPLLAIALHRDGLQSERDAAIDFLLEIRSLQSKQSPENDLNTQLRGWPWVPNTFGWVEPTSWALMALNLAGQGEHPRAKEARQFLEDRCIREGGWNYGNKVVFNHTLMPFWDTTALALLALGESNTTLAKKNLDLLEESLPEIHSLLSSALVSLCLERFGRPDKGIRDRVLAMILDPGTTALNLSHSAMGVIALSRRRVLTP